MKPNRLKESDLLTIAKAVLERLKGARLLSYRRIHTTGIPNGPGRFRPNLNMNGMADLQVYLKGGVTLHIELKTPRNKQTEGQLAFQKELESMGHFYYLVRSFEDLMQVLKVNGIAYGSIG